MTPLSIVGLSLGMVTSIGTSLLLGAAFEGRRHLSRYP